MKINVDASDFTAEQIKQILDKERLLRNMPLPTLAEQLEETRKQLALLLIKLDETFAKEIFETVKVYHPELLKDMTL